VTAQEHTLAPPSPRERLLGLLLVIHPIPSAMYVVAVALFSPLAADAAHRTLDGGTLARVLIAVACTQMAIGATNDYRDRGIDQISRPEKPLVRGLIEPWHAATLAAAATVCMLALMAPLGPAVLLLGILIEGLGLAYDLGLKGTPASALLYAIYFPLIPLLAWTVFGSRQAFLPWLLPVGALLGVAMNIANSLPDLEDDQAAGVRGLPHLLGKQRSLAAAWGLPILALLLAWVLDLVGAAPARTTAMAAATAAVLLSTLAAMGLFQRRPTPSTLRTTFIIQALGVVGMGAGWLAAVAF
jgi:4-hydroxybenzoate polyprenyltransferase